MSKPAGHCPKCGARLWLGPVADVNAASKLDQSKRWNEFSTPKMNCRKCGIPLRYADLRKYRQAYFAVVLLLIAGTAVAFWAWGPLGAVAAVLGSAAVFFILMQRVTYEHDS